jgi:hypothetical protein
MDTASNLHPNLHYTNLLQSQTPNLKHINHSHRRMPETYIYESRLRISVRHLLPTTTNLAPCFSRSTLHPTSPHPTHETQGVRPSHLQKHAPKCCLYLDRDQGLYQDFLPALPRHFTMQPPLKIAHTRFAIQGKQRNGGWRFMAVNAHPHSPAAGVLSI